MVKLGYVHILVSSLVHIKLGDKDCLGCVYCSH
jgi:hypothetical protein